MKNRTLLIIWFAGMAIAGSLTAIALLVLVSLKGDPNPVGVWDHGGTGNVLIVKEDGSASYGEIGSKLRKQKYEWKMEGSTFTIRRIDRRERTLFGKEQTKIEPWVEGKVYTLNNNKLEQRNGVGLTLPYVRRKK